MLVEISFQESTVCPFCGEFLGLQREVVPYSSHSQNYSSTMYVFVCKNHHMAWVSVERFEINDELKIINRCFVHYQDWEDHIDMSITPGPFEIPHLDDEDDAWIIHLLALENYQEDSV